MTFLKGKPGILLVEDNPADASLIHLAIKSRGLDANIHHVQDGEDAILFLTRQRPFKKAPHVDLVLLDLNLPKRDGREVLVEIRSDKRLEHLPVIVLTTSEAEDDILSCYRLNANCYICKPADLNELRRMVSSLFDFWFTIAKLPPRYACLTNLSLES